MVGKFAASLNKLNLSFIILLVAIVALFFDGLLFVEISDGYSPYVVFVPFVMIEGTLEYGFLEAIESFGALLIWIIPFIALIASCFVSKRNTYMVLILAVLLYPVLVDLVLFDSLPLFHAGAGSLLFDGVALVSFAVCLAIAAFLKKDASLPACIVCALLIVVSGFVFVTGQEPFGSYGYIWEPSSFLGVVLFWVSIVLSICKLSLTNPKNQLPTLFSEKQSLLRESPKKNTRPVQHEVTQESPSLTSVNDVANEILALKELVDLGAITQEEFEEKKKQILGI